MALAWSYGSQSNLALNPFDQLSWLVRFLCNVTLIETSPSDNRLPTVGNRSHLSGGAQRNKTVLPHNRTCMPFASPDGVFLLINE